MSLVKGGFQKPVLAVEVEKAPNSSKERELELMKEIEDLKKRLRDIDVSFEERKSFQSGYARSQRDKTKCFACGRMGHITRNCRVKEDKIPIKEENFQRNRNSGKETWD